MQLPNKSSNFNMVFVRLIFNALVGNYPTSLIAIADIINCYNVGYGKGKSSTYFLCALL